MKKIILFIMLLIMSAASFSQETKPAPALTKQDYLLKSKHQKTAAWVLAGGGVGLLLIGAITSVDKFANTLFIADSDPGAGPVLLVLGGIALLTSSPLFIASGKNKRRAMSMSFKNETAPLIQKSGLVSLHVPSLAFKISL